MSRMVKSNTWTRSQAQICCTLFIIKSTLHTIIFVSSTLLLRLPQSRVSDHNLTESLLHGIGKLHFLETTLQVFTFSV